MSDFVAAVRSTVYALVFYIGSIPLVIAGALLIPFGQERVIALNRMWGRFHAWCARFLLGIRVVIEGTLPQAGAIVAFKHEAMLETLEVARLFDRPAVVFKAELLKIPLWGLVAQAHGVIPVARETGATALRRMLKAARRAVAAGRPVVIFPEGTRVPHGECPPLRPGMAGLYKTLGLPVVPVAVDSGRVWPSSFVKRPGIVTIRVGDAIPAGLSREEVEARVHAGINALND